jgi:hypothetical protein
MPPGEHSIGQVQQFLPDDRPAVLAVNHRLKTSTQVRPAKLAAAEPVVRLPPIRRDHLPIGRTE